MSRFYSQQCPLCGSAAEYCWVDAHNRKYFECPKCKMFQISKRAEVILNSMSDTAKAAYAALSPRAPEGTLFVVRMPSAEHREVHPGDELQASFATKDSLALDCE